MFSEEWIYKHRHNDTAKRLSGCRQKAIDKTLALKYFIQFPTLVSLGGLIHPKGSNQRIFGTRKPLYNSQGKVEPLE